MLSVARNNALDLGFLICLQSVVVKPHREQQTDNEALTTSVMGAWDEIPFTKLSNVISRIHFVLLLVAEDNREGWCREQTRTSHEGSQ